MNAALATIAVVAVVLGVLIILCFTLILARRCKQQSQYIEALEVAAEEVLMDARNCVGDLRTIGSTNLVSGYALRQLRAVLRDDA